MGLRMHLLGGHKSTHCICPFRKCAEGLKRWFSTERVLAALPEVLSSPPGTHILSPTTTVTPAPEDLSYAFFWPLQIPSTHMHAATYGHTCIHIIKIK